MVAHFCQSKINKYIIKKINKRNKKNQRKNVSSLKKQNSKKKKRLENGVQKSGPQKPTDF